MKHQYLAATLLALAAQQTFAAEVYVSAVAGVQHTRYDVSARIEQELDEGNRRQAISVLELIGGETSVNSDLIAGFAKYTVGVAFTSSTALELSYRRYGNVTLQAGASLAGDGHILFAERGHELEIDAELSASSSAKATAQLRGVGLALVQRVYGPAYVRLGVERVKATIVQEEQNSLSYSYRVRFDDEVRTGANSESSTSIRRSVRHQIAPLMGLGFNFDLTDSVALRAEVEHVGIGAKGVDFYSMALVYRFK